MPSDLNQNPIEEFRLWLDAACDTNMHEPTAMNLATCDQNGVVSARMVLLKTVDQRGFVFYTNYQSRKAEAMNANAHVALCFWWGILERQVRVEGQVELISAEESDEYFGSRPRRSQLGAIASRQSQVLTSYQELQDRVDQLERQYAPNEAVSAPGVLGRLPGCSQANRILAWPA